MIGYSAGFLSACVSCSTAAGMRGPPRGGGRVPWRSDRCIATLPRFTCAQFRVNAYTIWVHVPAGNAPARTRVGRRRSLALPSAPIPAGVRLSRARSAALPIRHCAADSANDDGGSHPRIESRPPQKPIFYSEAHAHHLIEQHSFHPSLPIPSISRTVSSITRAPQAQSWPR